jgi:3-hydroxypropanoate dehydrogenase
MSASALTEQAFDILFRKAHTANGWVDKPVSDDILHKIYDIMKWGPTSFNCSPLRIVFVKTPEAKERLKPALMAGNVPKTMSAPVTAIFAKDTRFHEHLPFLYPAIDAKAFFDGNEALIAGTATRNATLQAAYFMVVARGFGLDCAPMSGFDNAKVDAAFFPDGRFKTDFICALGHADPAKNYPRAPRFKFEDVCRIA